MEAIAPRTLVSRYGDGHTQLVELDRLVPFTAIAPRVTDLVRLLPEQGLDYPLFACPAKATAMMLKRNKLGWPVANRDDWLEVFVGCQRLQAAYRLGIERISVSIWPSREAGFYSPLCIKCRGAGQRKWWLSGRPSPT